MLDWLFHKKRPQFWQKYAQQFQNQKSQNLEQVRFVVFDTETTGLDSSNDRILSIGAVSVSGNSIHISDVFERFLIQEKFNTETVEIHGILKTGDQQKIPEQQAIQEFLAYVRNSILIAHHAAFDVNMINQALKRLGLPRLKNKVLDTGILFKKLNEVANKHYGLDFLCEEFKVPTNDRHTATGDAFITAQIFLKLMARMKKERSVTLDDLFVNRNKQGLL